MEEDDVRFEELVFSDTIETVATAEGCKKATKCFGDLFGDQAGRWMLKVGCCFGNWRRRLMDHGVAANVSEELVGEREQSSRRHDYLGYRRRLGYGPLKDASRGSGSDAALPEHLYWFRV